MLLLLIKQIRSPIMLMGRMFLFPKRNVYANDLQLVNRNQIPTVYKGRNHGILAFLTRLRSATSQNDTVGERLVE